MPLALIAWPVSGWFFAAWAARDLWADSRRSIGGIIEHCFMVLLCGGICGPIAVVFIIWPDGP